MVRTFLSSNKHLWTRRALSATDFHTFSVFYRLLIMLCRDCRLYVVCLWRACIVTKRLKLGSRASSVRQRFEWQVWRRACVTGEQTDKISTAKTALAEESRCKKIKCFYVFTLLNYQELSFIKYACSCVLILELVTSVISLKCSQTYSINLYLCMCT